MHVFKYFHKCRACISMSHFYAQFHTMICHIKLGDHKDIDDNMESKYLIFKR